MPFVKRDETGRVTALYREQTPDAQEYLPSGHPEVVEFSGDLGSALKAIVSQRLLRTVHNTRIPAVEVMLNTRLTSELIEQGNFSGVKEAMNNSLAEGSQTFEQDIARLIMEGQIDRKEGLAYADSPTNLMWRLQNDFSRATAGETLEIASDEALFTDITLEVHPSDKAPAGPAPA